MSWQPSWVKSKSRPWGLCINARSYKGYRVRILESAIAPPACSFPKPDGVIIPCCSQYDGWLRHLSHSLHRQLSSFPQSPLPTLLPTLHRLPPSNNTRQTMHEVVGTSPKSTPKPLFFCSCISSGKITHLASEWYSNCIAYDTDALEFHEVPSDAHKTSPPPPQCTWRSAKMRNLYRKRAERRTCRNLTQPRGSLRS